MIPVIKNHTAEKKHPFYPSNIENWLPWYQWLLGLKEIPRLHSDPDR
jgi:hypothetical protein